MYLQCYAMLCFYLLPRPVNLQLQEFERKALHQGVPLLQLNWTVFGPAAAGNLFPGHLLTQTAGNVNSLSACACDSAVATGFQIRAFKPDISFNLDLGIGMPTDFFSSRNYDL